jgi:peptidoglycan hydrolase-like protein with peptidoglycan-binding domain
MTTLEAMKALSGTDSRKINDTLSKDIGDHRDKISWLKGRGADAGALAGYESSVNQLAGLLRLSQNGASDAGTAISGHERGLLLEQSSLATKASVQDFKVKQEGETTVARASGDPAKTTTDTLTRNQGESFWRHAGTGERVGESIDGSVASANESRRMTKADGEGVWRDEKTGKPLVDVSDAAVKRASAEATGGKATAAGEANDPYKTSAGKTYREGASIDDLKAGKKSLFEGDKGPAVTELQNRLKAAGYDIGKNGADGKYGPDTQKAVEAYKRDLGMPAGTTKDVGISGKDFEQLSGFKAGSKPTATGATITDGASTRESRLGATNMSDVSARVKDALASGNTGRANELLGRMNSAELAEVRKQIGTKKFEELIGGTRQTLPDGRLDTDYREALQASAFGDRKAIKDGDVASFTERLKGADTAPNIFAQGLRHIGMGGAGTNEQEMNKLFDLDNASLKKVDAELRKSYPGGLREFIASNYGGADNSKLTLDLFNKRFDAAGL